jgi:hypothetical protein
MALNDTSKLSIAFKKLVGKAHTDNGKAFFSEAFGSSVQVASQSIPSLTFPVSPASTNLYDITLSSGVQAVELVRLELVLDPTSNNFAYYAKLPAAYQSSSTNTKSGTAPFLNGQELRATAGAIQIVPPSYGTIYEAKPYIGGTAAKGSGTLVPPGDARDWVLDYFNGIFTQQTVGTAPSYIECYIYIGPMVTDGLAGGANRTLSNLTSPTAINQPLYPASNGAFGLGASALAWNSLFVQDIRPSNGSVALDITNRFGQNSSGDQTLNWQLSQLKTAATIKLDWSSNLTSYTNFLPDATANNRTIGSSSNRWLGSYIDVMIDGSDNAAFNIPQRMLLNASAGNALDFSSTTETKTFNDLVPSANNSKKLGSNSFKFSESHVYDSFLYGATSGNIKLEAADTTTSYSIKLPPVAPVVGQVLKATSASDLSWAYASGGFVKVRLYDPSSITLPTGNPTPIDGVNVQADDLVLFSNLSSGDNQVYKAVGTGSNITSWVAQSSFDGNLNPTDGDRVAILEGDAFADQVAAFGGSEWYINDKVRHFNGLDYMEQSSLNTIAIANNTTADIFLINYAGSENMVIEYSIKRGTVKETGRVLVTTDGTAIGISYDSTNLGASGVTFTADVNTPSAGNLRLRYTSDNGTTGIMKYTVRRWSDNAGGPGSFPSYTLPTSTISGSGSNGQITFWNGTSTITGSNLFKVNTSTQAIEMNGMDQIVLQTQALVDNVVSAASVFSYPDSFKHVVIEYGISRGSNFRTGRILVTQDGVAGSLSDDFVEQGTTGVTFLVDVSGGSVFIKYLSTNTGVNPQIKYNYRRW